MTNQDDMRQQPSTPAPNTPGPRQLFDSDVSSPCPPFSDLFNSPSIQDKRMAQSWDRKLDALNKRMMSLSRQMTDMQNMMSYIVQKLNDITTVSGTSSGYMQGPSSSVSGTVSYVPISVNRPTCDSISATTIENMTSSPAASAMDEQFNDLPTHCRIPAEDIIKMRRHSKSVGNFAALLTMRLFPELFTQDNLRFKFNYNGNGHSKEPLESQRRSYLQRYMLYFFPHLSNPKAYHDSVIDYVNEILRRKKLKPTGV